MSHYFSHDKLLQTRVAKAPMQMSKWLFQDIMASQDIENVTCI